MSMGGDGEGGIEEHKDYMEEAISRYISLNKSVVWDPYGGGEITREEWIRRGGDPKELDENKIYKFYKGAWVQQTQGDQRGPKGGPVPYYGNFLGPGPTSNANPYTLRGYDGKILKPIDMLDQASQTHDYGYYLANAGGIRGTLFDTSVNDADKRLALAADMVILYSVFFLQTRITFRPLSLVTCIRNIQAGKYMVRRIAHVVGTCITQDFYRPYFALIFPSILLGINQLTYI